MDRNLGPVFALLAGEASGDQLGADLITALRGQFPTARFVGVGGPQMRDAGFEAWHGIEALSVMGFAEVVRHLPRLLRLRRELTRRLLALRPDVFVGIDAPDFNLGLERRLKDAGIATVHYVSPSIWAWRENRVGKIGRAADRVLCLFPMEPAIYARHGIDARFVGHPLAMRFPLTGDRAAARNALGLPAEQPVLAVLPGSRPSEISRLAPTFLAAAQQVAKSVPGLRVVVPAANDACRELLEGMLKTRPGTRDTGTDASHDSAIGLTSTTGGSNAAQDATSPQSPGPGSRVPGPDGRGPDLLTGHSHQALLAADVVLVASGTATLEAMLAKRPMVVGYRVAPASYRIARALRMLKTDIYALPNILARADDPQAPLPVPELMQDAFTASNLAAAVLGLFHAPEHLAAIAARFTDLHRKLRGTASALPAAAAAAAIADLVAARPPC